MKQVSNNNFNKDNPVCENHCGQGKEKIGSSCFTCKQLNKEKSKYGCKPYEQYKYYDSTTQKYKHVNGKKLTVCSGKNCNVNNPVQINKYRQNLSTFVNKCLKDGCQIKEYDVSDTKNKYDSTYLQLKNIKDNSILITNNTHVDPKLNLYDNEICKSLTKAQCNLVNNCKYVNDKCLLNIDTLNKDSILIQTPDILSHPFKKRSTFSFKNNHKCLHKDASGYKKMQYDSNSLLDKRKRLNDKCPYGNKLAICDNKKGDPTKEFDEIPCIDEGQVYNLASDKNLIQDRCKELMDSYKTFKNYSVSPITNINDSYNKHGCILIND